MLVALVAGLIGEQPLPLLAGVAVGAALAGTALDGVDGWLARRTNMASDFGARFDMEIDALLILALSILALHHEKAGIWVLASGLLRYSFVAAGWLLPWLRRPLSYSRRRQTICVVQIVGLIVTIAPFVPMPWSALAAGTALAMLCGSFLADVVWLWRQSAAATYHAGFSYPLSR
jgi:phosphatidylglycerophosphate synthase